VEVTIMLKQLGFAASIVTILSLTQSAMAADQTVPGAGNAAAEALANRSPIVRSARWFLSARAASLHDAQLRDATVDALDNPNTCIRHRAGMTDAKKAATLATLRAAGLLDPADDATFPGGLKAGVFPPVLADGSACPKLPQSFFSAPGSVFGGHHSFPGGLAVHESLNDVSDTSLGAAYRRVYGHTNAEGLPEISLLPSFGNDPSFFIDEDILIGAPLWHDWAKPIVFQWNADGTEFAELSFGGNGVTDNAGQAGNSKTGAHHILGVAEAMKRNLPAEFIITQASAHSNPTSGNEYKVVNWLIAAAIIADVDPVQRGYIRRDATGAPRLPALRSLGSVDLNALAGSPPNLLIEYTTHNLSDADFTFTGPAVTEAQALLAVVAAKFGYDPSDTARYNTKFRNPALSYLTGERLTVLYANGGIHAIEAEISKLRRLGVL
jgi:hypothetical protein